MWHIIINPAAGNGKAGRFLPSIENAFAKAKLPYTILQSERPWHCAILAKEAIEKGARKIIAVGGDGTGHEVVNGIFSQNRVNTKEISFAVIPVGTGNDWIKNYQLPKKLNAIIPLLKAEKHLFQDIGLVHFNNEKGEKQQRYFVNVAGMAYDAHVAKAAENINFRYFSKIYYYFLIFKCLFSYTIKSARLTLDERKIIEKKFYAINVGLCRYSGGGMQFTPHALPDDGLFAVTTIDNMKKIKVMLSTHYLYGNIAKHPKGELFKAKSVTVESMDEGETLLELDGEFVGCSPIKFELIEKSLKVIIP